MDELNFFYNDSNENLKQYEKTFSELLNHTKEVLNIEQNLSMSITFIDPEESIAINKQYRNKDYVGDVLSFPIDDPLGIYAQLDFKEIGDIFITYDEALKKAKLYQHTIYEEMCWLFVHGLLHILGYDHETNENDAQIMFGLTDNILNKQNVVYKIV
ncbi:rRNA maturation RNase YbeY [Spiroplasma culicicola]|uniref:Endoribonuclease YbeY n=1 Tax=Spiroplasma culicicola AES-1 TaxID=1276246 RepID=W6AHB7_9MOLU|nr:rRNA maturation RNase YbeY [Spiroplasma culicicola]AHI53079.1 metalloprotease [Spiroplasma culicicola AES-1]